MKFLPIFKIQRNEQYLPQKCYENLLFTILLSSEFFNIFIFIITFYSTAQSFAHGKFRYFLLAWNKGFEDFMFQLKKNAFRYFNFDCNISHGLFRPKKSQSVKFDMEIKGAGWDEPFSFFLNKSKAVTARLAMLF